MGLEVLPENAALRQPLGHHHHTRRVTWKVKNMVQHVEFTFRRTSCIDLLFSDPAESKHLGVESAAFGCIRDDQRVMVETSKGEWKGVHVESE